MRRSTLTSVIGQTSKGRGSGVPSSFFPLTPSNEREPAGRRWSHKAKLWQRRMWRAAGDLLFPPRCVVCAFDLTEEDAVSPEVAICRGCASRFLGPSYPRCIRCGAIRHQTHNMPRSEAATTEQSGESEPQEEASTAGSNSPAGCPTCERQTLRFSRLFLVGSYEDPLRRVVLRTKNITQEYVSFTLAELLCHCAGQGMVQWKPDVVVPIPMFWTRRILRGTSSPDLMAPIVARHCQAEPLPALRRVRQTLRQGDLPRSARQENVRGAFGLRWGYQVRGARVLLVDDILTTGFTCNEAARTLRKAGASDVAVAVIARADTPK